MQVNKYAAVTTKNNFKIDVQYWYKPHTTEGPGPLRAHTATSVEKKVSNLSFK